MGRYDYIIIGSGFGGSVSALRLAEKGYKVAVVEQGRRYRPADFPQSNWRIRKFFWLPSVGLYGIQAMTLLKDVFIFHGAGVGGGSLVYANNLLIPPDEVFEDPAWDGSDWKERLRPYYQVARRMLGAVPSPSITSADTMLRECAAEIGREDTFHINDVGVFFGEEGETAPDPYFDGVGPDRTGCTLCGACMTGCRVGAKNTLDHNYLYLAEKLGVEIIPDTRVIDVRAAGDGGYELQVERASGLLSPRRSLEAAGVIFSAGVLGTVRLLFKCSQNGSLPGLSLQLGNYVRTNSEALVAAKARGGDEDYSKGLAISTGIYPDAYTHIETVRYGQGQDVMSLLATSLTGGGKPWPRPLRWLAATFRHPIRVIRNLNPFGWAKRTIVLLVMQTRSNYMRLEFKRRWWRLGGRSMNTFWTTDQRVPSHIPVANDFAKRMAAKMKGDAFSVLPEVVFDTSSTAHILGGCIMGASAADGVIDFTGKVHGYDNLYVVDGSMVPANLGVNPSLTITAMAEYVMSQLPEKQDP